MTRGAIQRNLGQAQLHLSESSLLDSAAIGHLVPLEILEYLMEGVHQPILFDLCPGISFQPHMTTVDTHSNLREA